MKPLSKLITCVVTGAVFLASLTGASVISAEEISGVMPEVTLYNYDQLSSQTNTYAAASASSESVVTTTAAESSAVVTTTVTAKSVVIPAVTSAVTETPAVVTTNTAFNVFDIYDAHIKFVATTTTAPPNQTVTTTTANPNTAPSKDFESGVKGIDVSKHQGLINWNSVKNEDVNFAIIRAGYGMYASQEDPYFDTNMVNAEKAGIPRGVYWYSYATTVEEAYREAEVCYQIIKDYNFEYPLFFDIEEDEHELLSTATVSAIIDAFCSTMQDKGYYVSVYSYASFLNTKVYSSILDKYDVWVAHFNVSSPSYSRPYGIWQYSSTGRISGISEYVDLNYAYKDYPYIISSEHFNGY
ncbi:MAG: glycoside hydrolase family 25 protein [Ruminococcus sp.]|nr:glycoside hydrolase family 25 protein [Ruminococcus sp.]